MKLIITTLLLLCCSQITLAKEAINTLGKGGSFFSGPKATGIAILGYDTVAYFKENKAVQGADQFQTEWSGATWKFSNKENLEVFKASPEKYAPQYGGYCAYGVAKGSLVKIEPDQFSIVDGKLYLNYDSGVQKKWSEDKQGYIKTADQKISELLKN